MNEAEVRIMAHLSTALALPLGHTAIDVGALVALLEEKGLLASGEFAARRARFAKENAERVADEISKSIEDAIERA
jgi:hypothetical protein